MSNLPSLSPGNLRHRVLAKGKVKPAKAQADSRSTTSRTGASWRTLSRLSLEEWASSHLKHSARIPESIDFARSYESQVDVSGSTCSLRDLTHVDGVVRKRELTAALRWTHRSTPVNAHRLKQGSVPLLPQVKAYRKTRRAAMSLTDESYAQCLSIRSIPFVRSARDAPEGGGALQMSSINEDFLLAQLGLPRTERNLIEGLQTRRISSAGANSGFGLTEEQISSRAVARLTADPSPKVGQLQRRTAKRLVRPCKSSFSICRP
jgi:hypothetical protein